MTPPTPVRTELAAMRRVADVLDALDPNTRHRVFGWIVSRYTPVWEDIVAEDKTAEEMP